MAVTLGRAIAASPIWLMILQLKDTVVVFMAELTAVLADPFHVAVLTRIKAGHLAFLPLVSKTVSIYLNWNALNLDLLTT